jgi:hypothetical protein
LRRFLAHALGGGPVALLDFGSIESGRLALRSEPQDPGGMIDETLAGFENNAEQADRRLLAELQPRLPQLCCDRDRII